MTPRGRVAAALIAAGAVLLFWNLGRPALWQDEAETALRAESILESGVPRLKVHGVLATAQPSLAAHEANASGVWTWDTWLPAYLCAASFAVLGPSPFAARLPFALAGALALWLWWRLFSQAEKGARRSWAPEVALALLALSPAYLLFCRQSRYYALVALGNALVIASWRRLLEKKPWGALALALSLSFLLHASFGFFAAAGLALTLDAALRFKECLRARRFWIAAVLTFVFSAPVAFYFRVWDRPGNHAYGFLESLEFLKTFFLWLAAFAVPLALVAAAATRNWGRVAVGFVLLCGLVAEGPASRLCAVLVLLALAAAAARAPAAPGRLSLRRACLLLIVATLGLLAFGAAEPYGRYLAGLLPACAYLAAVEIDRLGRERAAVVAGLTAAAVSCNILFLAPLKAAQAFAAPDVFAESVSGMMRRRLRDLGARSDLLGFLNETARGAGGYIEPAAAAMRAGGGATFYSDADQLSVLFATGLRPVYPDELASSAPDWILVSPWLGLSPREETRVGDLLASGRYQSAGVTAPRLLWQNNPDPLYHVYAPAPGPLPLYRLRR